MSKSTFDVVLSKYLIGFLFGVVAVLIGLVGLLVTSPEDLPTDIATLNSWMYPWHFIIVVAVGAFFVANSWRKARQDAQLGNV